MSDLIFVREGRLRGICLFIFILATCNAMAMSPSMVDVCGLFEAQDLRDHTAYTLVDYLTFPGLARTYNITNMSDNTRLTLVDSHCYCVSGVVSDDPDFSGDSMFKRLTISEIVTGPYNGCTPPQNPATK